MWKITYSDIRNNPEINTYIKKGDELLGMMGFTDHSEIHTQKLQKLRSDTQAG